MMLEPHMALFVAPTGVGKSQIYSKESTLIISTSLSSSAQLGDTTLHKEVECGFGLIFTLFRYNRAIAYMIGLRSLIIYWLGSKLYS